MKSRGYSSKLVALCYTELAFWEADQRFWCVNVTDDIFKIIFHSRERKLFVLTFVSLLHPHNVSTPKSYPWYLVLIADKTPNSQKSHAWLDEVELPVRFPSGFMSHWQFIWWSKHFYLLREDLEKRVKDLCNRLSQQHLLCPHSVKARRGLKPYSDEVERSTQPIELINN